ncbi:MAG: hypothetical protein ABJH45_17000 [Paracoccaceae bacterium]
MSYYGNFSLALAISLFAPVQAIALKCAAPANPIDIVNEARLDPDTLIVGYGTFSADTSIQSEELDLLQSNYQFDGVVFRGGEALPVDPGTVITSTSCDHDIWCHHRPLSFVEGHAYLVVLGQNPSTGELGVHAGLCSSSVVLRSDSANLDVLAVCLSSGTCAEADLGELE